MHSRLSSSRTFVFHRSGLRWGLHLLCLLLNSPRYSAPIARHPAPMLRSIEEISRGKTRYFHRIDAEFTECTPTTADGGLRSHAPARPRRITPHIRFLFIVPQFRIELPSDPASRRRPCPSPCLRLCENLAVGLSPTKQRTMPGAHAHAQPLPRGARPSAGTPCWAPSNSLIPDYQKRGLRKM